MKRWETPAAAIGIGTCLETKVNQYGALNSRENQTFLGEVSIVSCQWIPQLLTPSAYEWIKGIPVLKRRIEFYCTWFPFPVHLPLLVSLQKKKGTVLLTCQLTKHVCNQMCPACLHWNCNGGRKEKHPTSCTWCVWMTPRGHRAPLKPQGFTSWACLRPSSSEGASQTWSITRTPEEHLKRTDF